MNQFNDKRVIGPRIAHLAHEERMFITKIGPCGEKTGLRGFQLSEFQSVSSATETS